jgi:uncharacterized protein YutE (UPF0331/DUF86 family)
MRRHIILTKFTEIEESISLVKDNLPKTLEEFTDLGLVKDGIYKRMEYALGNVFDICAIISSDLKLGMPLDEKGVLQNIEEANILSDEMIITLKSMRGFRNILVHRYGHIDDQMAYQNIKLHLNDFSKFRDEVEKLF